MNSIQLAKPQVFLLIRRLLCLAAAVLSSQCGTVPINTPPCLVVHVKSQNGAFLDNARINVLPPSEFVGFPTEITTSGNAQFPFCTGTHTIEVTLPGYRTKEVTYTSPRPRARGGNTFVDEITVVLDSQ